MRDHYETLCVPRTASDAEIKAAYRTLALQFHPDRNPGDAVAEERFKDVSMAYAVLSEPDKRAHYDRFGFLGDANPFGGVNSTSATDFFDAVFGDLLGLGRKKRATGRDLRYTLELEFEEAMLGCHKTIAFDRAEDCGECRGTGARGGAAGLMKCNHCAGQGFLRQKAGLLGGRRECAVCGGQGELPRIACATCAGSGIVDKRREFNVANPAGTASGATQRVEGQGSPGRRGGVAGDLHVVVRLRPHPFYARQADVLVVEVPLSIGEATLGAEVDVPVLDGVVRMKIPRSTQTGSVFRIRSKGIPRVSGGRGDCHVRVTIETPGELGLEARALLEGLERAAEASLPRRRAFRARVAASELARLADEEPLASSPVGATRGAEKGAARADGKHE